MSDQTASQSASLCWGKPPLDPIHRTFVCFGSPRGGTSAIAGIMRKFGLFMGHNPQNNHEDSEISSKPVGDQLRVIEERNRSHRVWGWKDPYAIDYIKVLLPEIRNPYFVLVTRDLVATSKGHMRWEDRDSKYALSEMAALQHRNVIFALSVEAPILLVSYEKAVLHPRSTIAELAEFMQVPHPEDDQPFVDFLAPGSYKDA